MDANWMSLATETTMLPNPEHANLPVLQLLVDNAVVHSFPLTVGTHLLGRSPSASIRLLDSSVSTEHARLDVAPSRFLEGYFEVTLTDLDSTNGTSVNGKRVTELVIQHLDELRIGRHVLVMHDPQAGSDPTLTSRMLTED